MKILRLDLQAFGPFTEQRLDLCEGEHGLHLVYGPNEAGKSSTLRALRQMLYGIDVQTADDFVHPYQNLRVGARLRHSSGDDLEFIRRKGNKNTLLAADGKTPLEDDALASFLGGVSGPVFMTMFGIDHERLTEGGQEIVKGHGELGQILFLAGSGISDLRSIQSALDEELGALFKPAGRLPRINAALSELRDTRAALKQKQLSSDEWTRRRRALENALKGKKRVEQDLEARQKEKNRLERIQRALPAFSKLKQCRDELAAIGDAKILDSDFPQRRRDAETKLQIARSRKSEARENLEKIEREFHELNVPQDLLRKADAIDELYRRLGSHQKAMGDRRDRVRECEQFEADAREMLRAIRPDLDLARVEQIRLTKPEQRRIRERGARQEALIREAKTRQEAATKVRNQLEELRRHFDGLPEPQDKDVEELRDLVRRIRTQGNLDEQLAGGRAALEKAEREAAITLEALPLWSASLEQLERLPVPANETIDRFERELSEAQARIDRLGDRIEKEADELRDINGQIEQIQLEREVPSEQDLTEARSDRDAGWQILRELLERQSHEQKAAEKSTSISRSGEIATSPRRLALELESPGRLIEFYEQSVVRADEVADRLRREAQQVAQKAKLLADRDKRTAHRERFEGRLADATAELGRLQNEWTALWEPLGIVPLPPKEMRAWAQQHESLTARSQALREQREKVAALEERIAGYRRELTSALMQSCGKAPAGDPIARLLQSAEERLAQVHRVEQERGRFEENLAEAERELPGAESAAAQAERELAEWQSTWIDDMERLGLRRDSTPAEASAFVDAVDELFKKTSEIEGHRKRIDDIDADARQFAADVRALTEAVAPDLAELPVDQAAATLNARLTEARAEQKRLESFHLRREEEEHKLQAATEAIRELTILLDAMCREAGCRSYEELPTAEDRSAKRQGLCADIEELEQRIRAESGGATLETFLGQAQTIDPDTLDFQIEQLAEKADELGRQRDGLINAIRDEEHALAQMDGNAAAADLADDEQTILARLESDVEQYVRLKLASTVLRAGIQRYREKNQTPVLKRTSELFSQLTLGSFAGLRDDYDEKGQAVLVGLRPGSDQPVPLDGMSDGACDQLYLALRIAGLETYLVRHEPLPFIVDDVLVNFDNDRAVAALQTLADFSRRAQVIFFTHHEHLVDLARRHLDGGVLFVHHLGA